MKVLVASAEFSPLARTGGLGDAVAGLCHALAASGVDVTAAVPRYRWLAGMGERGPGPGPADALHRLERDGVELALIDDPEAFDRPGDVYGPEPGTGFEDSWWRWGRFALAVAAMAPDYDLVHLHDAHVGGATLLTDVPTVFTIHNPAYPVLGGLAEIIDLLGLGPEAADPAGPIEWYGDANYLKAGIAASGQATTVSPSFARQLGGDPDESFGLGSLVRRLERPLAGILNGIDVTAWDPERDPWLPAPFSAADPTGRAVVRAALLERTGLADGVVFGNVGRVSEQKGFALVDRPLDDLVAAGFRFVVVGNGDRDDLVDSWVLRHPDAVAHLEFADDVARLAFGGADAYLMPSKFEPSGLGQLYAMRYGCPPVVRLTGGLADSVADGDTGIGFEDYTPEALEEAVTRAMRQVTDTPAQWAAMRRRGMERDFSWQAQAGEYVKLYRAVC